MEHIPMPAETGNSIVNSYSAIHETTLAGKPVKLNLDARNKRIKILDYHRKNIDILARYLAALSQKTFDKIIVLAGEDDWQDFLAQGYVMEGFNRGHHQGRPGYYMVRFLTTERRMSHTLIQEDQSLREILKRSRASVPPPLPSGYALRDAVPEDIPQIVDLFKRIFLSYPSPITDSDYLSQFLKNHKFQVITHGNLIISTASAEIDRRNLTAEMTDCACLPEHRGLGLVTCLLHSIEQELFQSGLKNLYSIARAGQPGINAVLLKLGYTYGGRFINNCTIGGQFENMNLWVKDL